MKEAMDYCWDDKLDNGIPVQVCVCDYEPGDDSVGAGSSCGVFACLGDDNGEEVELTRAEEMRFMLMGLDLYEDYDED